MHEKEDAPEHAEPDYHGKYEALCPLCPLCPRCRAVLRWNARQGWWFCHSCGVAVDDLVVSSFVLNQLTEDGVACG